MKIVFIQPKTFDTWEALNIGYLAPYLRLHGYNEIIRVLPVAIY